MSRWMKKIGEAIKDTAQTVGFVPQKTVDLRYENAKEVFRRLSYNSQELIGHLLQMQMQIKQLARASVRLSENVSDWYKDAPETQKMEAMTIESFAKSFDDLTANFLFPRIDPHLVRPISLFHQEIERLSGLREMRKEARKEMDSANSKLKHAVARVTDNLSKQDVEFQEAKRKFEKYNEEFISGVDKMENIRLTEFQQAYRSMVGILSQYLILLFTELQKFRTTFPPELFDDGNKNAK